MQRKKQKTKHLSVAFEKPGIVSDTSTSASRAGSTLSKNIIRNNIHVHLCLQLNHVLDKLDPETNKDFITKIQDISLQLSNLNTQQRDLAIEMHLDNLSKEIDSKVDEMRAKTIDEFTKRLKVALSEYLHELEESQQNIFFKNFHEHVSSLEKEIFLITKNYRIYYQTIENSLTNKLDEFIKKISKVILSKDSLALSGKLLPRLRSSSRASMNDEWKTAKFPKNSFEHAIRIELTKKLEAKIFNQNCDKSTNTLNVKQYDYDIAKAISDELLQLPNYLALMKNLHDEVHDLHECFFNQQFFYNSAIARCAITIMHNDTSPCDAIYNLRAHLSSAAMMNTRVYLPSETTESSSSTKDMPSEQDRKKHKEESTTAKIINILGYHVALPESENPPLDINSKIKQSVLTLTSDNIIATKPLPPASFIVSIPEPSASIQTPKGRRT